MKSCIVLLAISARAASGYALPAAAAAMPRLRGLDRARIATMGFEVEDIDDQAVAELGVFSWPGLEKRTSEFTQSAGAEELLMVFVQSGTATLTDDEESVSVKEGQMVMVSDGEVKWSDLSEGGLTLIQSTAELKDVEDDEDEVEEKTDVAPKTAEDDPVEDLSIKDAAILLAAGLGAGAVAAFGFNTFNSGG